MDVETLRRIRERAYALWEEDGRPEGREQDYWLRAEEDILNQSVTGEEDPFEALDHQPPGSDRGSQPGG